MKKASVVITLFNAENYILETLKSVKAQRNISLGELEIVMVNDKSTDRGLQLVKRFISNNPKLDIRLLDLPKNGGVSKARNIGAGYSTGKFILHVDGDDLLHEDCVSEFSRIFMDPSIGFAYSDHAAVQPTTKCPVREDDIIYIKQKTGFDLKSFLEEKYNYVAHAKAVRKELHLPFDPSLKYAEDSDWVIRTALEGINFGHIPKILYYWRRGVNSVSDRTSKEERDRFHNFVFNRGLKVFKYKK